MLKAQEMYLSKYNIDIEGVITLSALSMRIFRSHYLNEEIYPIHILNRNEDTFIRLGYYGGHSDVYKPSGENLYYYDINSLYPFVMSKYPMPCGKPIWRNNLQDVELDTLYGFIEAYVFCPKEIKHPFLPYRDQDKTLLFPTGEFIGVYYSEELKYARNLGYKIIPLRGYMFEKKSSPFESFVSSLYKSRQEAKKEGSEAMSFIYKICMNSLYGRLGMNPESTVTEICSEDRYNKLLSMSNFQSAEKLNDDYYIVNIISNSGSVRDEDWIPPRNLAVQMSAAITACARIEMYPFISRDDCYYTDTDSVVLGSPLPEDLISSVELGKFKLEDKLQLGIFLAPKSYMYETKEKNDVIKHKGPAKDLVTSEWFVKQLADLSRTEVIQTSANFRIDWRTLQILKKEQSVKLGLPYSRKRKRVYNENNMWIDTEPVEVIDIEKLDPTTRYKLELMDLKAQMAEKDAEIKELKDHIAQNDIETNAEIKELKAKDALRDSQIEDLKENNAQLKENNAQLKEMIAQKDSLIEDLKEMIEDLKEKLAQKDFETKAEIKELKATVGDLCAKVEDLQALLAEKDKDKQKEEIEDKDKHISESDKQMAVISDKISHLEAVKAKVIADKDKEIDEMSKSLEEIEEKISQMEANKGRYFGQFWYHEKISNLESEKITLTQEIYSLGISKFIHSSKLDEKIRLLNCDLSFLKYDKNITEEKGNITEEKGNITEEKGKVNCGAERDASTEGQNTPTVQPTLYNTKAEAKKARKAKKAEAKKAKKAEAKKYHDNRPKPD